MKNAMAGHGLQVEVLSANSRGTGIARPLANAADLEPLLQALGRDQGGGQRSFAASTRVVLAM